MDVDHKVFLSFLATVPDKNTGEVKPKKVKVPDYDFMQDTPLGLAKELIHGSGAVQVCFILISTNSTGNCF